MSNYKRINVSLDFCPIRAAITDGTRWNGWRCPWFSLEVAKQVLAEHMSSEEDAKDGGYSFYEYDEVYDVIIEKVYDGYTENIIFDVVTYHPIFFEGVKYYPIGYGNWCWSEDDTVICMLPSLGLAIDQYENIYQVVDGRLDMENLVPADEYGMDKLYRISLEDIQAIWNTHKMDWYTAMWEDGYRNIGTPDVYDSSLEFEARG